MIEWVTDPGKLDECAEKGFELDYATPMMREGTQTYIHNVDTTLHLVRVGRSWLPVTVNDTEYENSYVCSPYSAYASYAKEELYLLRSPLLEKALSGLLAVIAPLLRASVFNKTAHMNNWLLSTNLHSELSLPELTQLTREAVAAYPEHTIIFRSLNETLNGRMMRDLAELGYRFVPSRQVYMFDGANPLYLNKTNTVRDMKLLQNSPFSLVQHDQFDDSDYARIKELYDFLYIEKYSRINPQFTEAYIRLCHRHNLMTFYGLRDEGGVLQGIVGCFGRGDVITAPLVGYNTSLPRELGLYRMLMAIVLKSAADRGLMLNLSSGASSFKLARGGTPAVEFSAVYDKHLPTYRRLPWRVLELLLTRIGVPLMQKYKL